MSVLVVGSVALDHVKTPFGEVRDAQGGSCSYASVSASYFADVAIVGCVGGDYPQYCLDRFSRHQINLDGLEKIQDGQTFRWAGYYEYDMAQAHTLDTQLNVFEKFAPKIGSSQRDSPFLLLGNIDPELQMRVLDQMDRPRLTMVDTMNLWISIKQRELRAVMAKCDIVLLNDAEARQLCNTANLQAAAREILTWGPKRVIIKKGEHGCLMFSENDYFSCPAFPLELVKDPTGAGDTFAGGFIGYLANQKELTEEAFRQAIVVGTTMASFTVEDFSLNRLANLEPAEISERCAALRRQTDFPAVSVSPRPWH
jgi:sugar/nucleoside kinase (ribokinase family)